MKKTLTLLLVAATGISTLGLAHAQVNTSGSGSINAAAATERPQRPKMLFKCIVENISNGITITLTSSNAEQVTKLQSEAAKHVQMTLARHGQGATDVQGTSENLTDGIKITLTSTNAETVTKLQTKPAKGPGMEGMQLKNVQVTKENLSNGVVITRTSTDAATVTKLQEMEAQHQARLQNPPADAPKKLEGVTVKVENLSNGVKTTLTSDNAETVTKLQSMPEKGPGHGHRGRGHRMDKAPTQE